MSAPVFYRGPFDSSMQPTFQALKRACDGITWKPNIDPAYQITSTSNMTFAQANDCLEKIKKIPHTTATLFSPKPGSGRFVVLVNVSLPNKEEKVAEVYQQIHPSDNPKTIERKPNAPAAAQEAQPKTPSPPAEQSASLQIKESKGGIRGEGVVFQPALHRLVDPLKLDLEYLSKIKYNPETTEKTLPEVKWKLNEEGSTHSNEMSCEMSIAEHADYQLFFEKVGIEFTARFSQNKYRVTLDLSIPVVIQKLAFLARQNPGDQRSQMSSYY